MSSKTIYRADYRALVLGLRQRRESVGLSQTDVARALDWPQQRLSAVEAGARRLDVVEFVELVGALGMTPTAALRLLTVKVPVQ